MFPKTAKCCTNTRFLSDFSRSQRGPSSFFVLCFGLAPMHPTHTNTLMILTHHTLLGDEGYAGRHNLPCQTKGCRDECGRRWKLHCWHGNHPIICMVRFDVGCVDGEFWVTETETERWRKPVWTSGVSAVYLPGFCFNVVSFFLLFLFFFFFLKRWLHDSEQWYSPSICHSMLLSCDAAGSHQAVLGQDCGALCVFMCVFGDFWVHVCCCYTNVLVQKAYWHITH